MRYVAALLIGLAVGAMLWTTLAVMSKSRPQTLIASVLTLARLDVRTPSASAGVFTGYFIPGLPYSIFQECGSPDVIEVEKTESSEQLDRRIGAKYTRLEAVVYETPTDQPFSYRKSMKINQVMEQQEGEVPSCIWDTSNWKN
jgi:hypothetical protein